MPIQSPALNLFFYKISIFFKSLFMTFTTLYIIFEKKESKGFLQLYTFL